MVEKRYNLALSPGVSHAMRDHVGEGSQRSHVYADHFCCHHTCREHGNGVLVNPLQVLNEMSSTQCLRVPELTFRECFCGALQEGPGFIVAQQRRAAV